MKIGVTSDLHTDVTLLNKHILPYVAQAAVKEQPAANGDETSWQEGNSRAWLWVVVTQVATVFLMLKTQKPENLLAFRLSHFTLHVLRTGIHIS